MTERHLSSTEEALLVALGRGPDGRSTDLASGGGIPAWIRGMLNFCSRCGKPLQESTPEGEHRPRPWCTGCGFISYINPRIVVTTIPVDAAGLPVLIRRGIPPGYNTWAQPGGFMEVDETVHEAAIRETLEETGLLVEPGRLVGLYSRLEAAVVVLVYEARIVGGEAHLTPEALEIRAFEPADIPWEGIALKTSWWGIRDWVALRHPDAPIPEQHNGRDPF